MSTERSYVGRGTNANPPTRTAPKVAKSPKKPDVWPDVICQLKELLSSSNSTVILLVVDQSTTTTITQAGSNNSSAAIVTANKGVIRSKNSQVKQRGTLNAADSSDLTSHFGDCIGKREVSREE